MGMRYQKYHHVQAHCLHVDRNQPNRIWTWNGVDGVQMRSEVMQWLEQHVGKLWQTWEFDTMGSRIYFNRQEDAMLFKLTWS
jgi:hypothetical protein